MIQPLILRVMELYRLPAEDAAALVMSDPGEGSILTGRGWRSPLCDGTLRSMLRIETGCSAEVASETVHRLRGRVPIRTAAQAWELGVPHDAPDVRIVGRRPGGYYLLANRRGWSRVVNQRRISRSSSAGGSLAESR